MFAQASRGRLSGMKGKAGERERGKIEGDEPVHVFSDLRVGIGTLFNRVVSLKNNALASHADGRILIAVRFVIR